MYIYIYMNMEPSCLCYSGSGLNPLTLNTHRHFNKNRNTGRVLWCRRGVFAFEEAAELSYSYCRQGMSASSMGSCSLETLLYSPPGVRQSHSALLVYLYSEALR